MAEQRRFTNDGLNGRYFAVALKDVSLSGYSAVVRLFLASKVYSTSHLQAIQILSTSIQLKIRRPVSSKV